MRQGGWLERGAREQSETLALLVRSAWGPGELDWRAAFFLAHQLANRSLFFVAVIMTFVGAILSVQACAQAQRIIGDLTAIGPAFLQLIVREFGPTIVALMIAARYGAGVSAELAAMTISEQIDALRMTGAEPARYLVAPRVVAGVLGMAPIAVLGTAISFVSGGFAAHYGFGVGWDTFFSVRMVQWGDLTIGLAKALAFGVAVPLWAARAGLVAYGGAPGVGRATTRGVIGASVAVLVLDLVVGTLGHLAFFSRGGA